MKRNRNVRANPALLAGLALTLAAQLVRSVLEPAGAWAHALCFAQGAAVGLTLVGLLYACPKTRPLFERFHSRKARLRAAGKGGEA